VAGDDVVAVALPILRHRLIINFAAQSEGVTVDEVIKQLIRDAAKAAAA
jgi:MoxR-like ATPase